jgi:SMI1 / KNR4 family (SUKH-1)
VPRRFPHVHGRRRRYAPVACAWSSASPAPFSARADAAWKQPLTRAAGQSGVAVRAWRRHHRRVTEDDIIEALRARVAVGRPADFQQAPTQVASPTDLEDVEAALGFALPPLLRRIYLEVANGGVGPFGGIEGLPPDGIVSDAGNLVDDYHAGQTEEWPRGEPPIPPKVMMLCDFGCAMWAMLDCRHPDGRMWWWAQGSRYKLDITLREWFSAWLTDGSNILATAPWLPDESFERSYHRRRITDET